MCLGVLRMKIGWPKGNINLNGLGFADDLALSAGAINIQETKKK